ncbi:hypothetical protein RTCIAT899_PA00450 (plasmid) [Rhizobium tropici CIAT 899]|nr:hypothetical protein RTCIAT899_PA00450 [Rhizobium tropici CIAT 899]
MKEQFFHVALSTASVIAANHSENPASSVVHAIIRHGSAKTERPWLLESRANYAWKLLISRLCRSVKAAVS